MSDTAPTLPPPAKFTPVIVCGALLVQLTPETFVHFNVTLGGPQGQQRAMQASVIGRPPTADQMKRCAQVVVEMLEGFSRMDHEPRRVSLL